MNALKNEETKTLDRAVDAARSEHPDPEVVRQAADRVWARLAAEAATVGRAAAPGSEQPIAGCDDYQALIPAYLAGELAPARRLLVEDHSRECVTCRRALIAARSGRPMNTPAPVVAARRDTAGRRLWLPLAAAVVLMVGLTGWWATDGMFSGPVAQIAAVDGTLMALGVDHAPGGVGTAAIGLALGAGQPVRTGKGSTAVVRLDDGSLVELAERTQISVRERRRGTTVTVDRGSVIVEAAPQREKHLYVATDEALVSVTGTIFAVQHGVRGSRVSVVEGEVRVQQSGTETVLHPGQQVTSRSTLASVSVAQEIGWSRNVDRYLAMLSELSVMRAEIARRVGPGELRHDGALMPLVPADAEVYVALPNVSTTVAESWAVFRERLTESPALATWWSEHSADGRAESIDQMVERLRVLGSHLGGEVVITFADFDGPNAAPMLLAEVTDAAALRAFVEQELAGLEGDAGGDRPDLVVVDDPADAGEGDLVLWITDGLLAASPDRDRLLAVAAARASGDGGFAGTELGQAVTRAYADGTEYLFALELGDTMRAEALKEGEEDMAFSGVADVERLLIERWDEGERGVMTAELSFAQARRGVASWLAAPAPMGALDFVSADAHLAAAFVVKQPAAILDDVLALSGAGGEQGGPGDFERELGLSLRDDLAAPLGGEIALALDGPLLPQPSWKAVVEVYDAARLQHTLETVVTRVNTERSREGEAPLVLAATESGGRTFYRLAGPGGYELNYLYVDGYLVAAPSQALLERTLAQRAAGSRLTASSRFRSLLPRDARADFSALLFQDLGPALAPLGNGMSQLGGSMTGEQRRQLAELMARVEPAVAYAYGDEDRILVGGTGPGGPFGLGFQAMTGLGSLAALGDLLGEAAEQAATTGPVS